MARNIYTLVNNRVTVGTAISLLQLKAGTSQPLSILRAWVKQNTANALYQTQASLIRKSVGATVTPAVIGTTLLKTDKVNSPDPTVILSSSGTGLTASAEGTDADEIWTDGFNILNGSLYLPTPLERIILNPGEIIALKFPVAPVSQTWSAGITFQEGA